MKWQQTGSRPHQNRPLPFSNQHIRGLIINSVVNVIDYFIFVVGVWFFGLDRQRKLDQPTNCLRTVKASPSAVWSSFLSRPLSTRASQPDRYGLRHINRWAEHRPRPPVCGARGRPQNGLKGERPKDKFSVNGSKGRANPFAPRSSAKPHTERPKEPRATATAIAAATAYGNTSLCICRSRAARSGFVATMSGRHERGERDRLEEHRPVRKLSLGVCMGAQLENKLTAAEGRCKSEPEINLKGRPLMLRTQGLSRFTNLCTPSFNIWA